jgi:hypothetical protein
MEVVPGSAIRATERGATFWSRSGNTFYPD